MAPINDDEMTGWEKFDNVLTRVLSGIEGVRNPGTIYVENGSGEPVVYTTAGGVTTRTTQANYMPILLIALVIVVLIVSQK